MHKARSLESSVGLASAQDFDNLWEERGPENNGQRHVALIWGMWNIDYYKGFELLEGAGGERLVDRADRGAAKRRDPQHVERQKQ
jgi:hypothetical protein